MSGEDLAFCQRYFRDEEGRDPTLTEIRVLDTYWSDHCRHTTFQTRIEEVVLRRRHGPGPRVVGDLQPRSAARSTAPDTDRPVTLMDIALMGMRELRALGRTRQPRGLQRGQRGVDRRAGRDHPRRRVHHRGVARDPVQERDPQPPDRDRAVRRRGHLPRRGDPRPALRALVRLSGDAGHRRGRSRAPRIPKPCPASCRSGRSARSPPAATRPTATRSAWPPASWRRPTTRGYVAKRMEIGAVIAAGPALAGPARRAGRWRRDPPDRRPHRPRRRSAAPPDRPSSTATTRSRTPPRCRRATRRPSARSSASSATRNSPAGSRSATTSAPAASRSPSARSPRSLEIDLDAVPKKYDGLDGTELAISESQERMAVLVDPADVDFFMAESDQREPRVHAGSPGRRPRQAASCTGGAGDRRSLARLPRHQRRPAIRAGPCRGSRRRTPARSTGPPAAASGATRQGPRGLPCSPISTTAARRASARCSTPRSVPHRAQPVRWRAPAHATRRDGRQAAGARRRNRRVQFHELGIQPADRAVGVPTTARSTPSPSRSAAWSPPGHASKTSVSPCRSTSRSSATTRPAGACRSPPCSARFMPSTGCASPRSAARTRCPGHSTTSTCPRPWSRSRWRPAGPATPSRPSSSTPAPPCR